MSASETLFDVVVVGAGLVGQSTALGLSLNGFSVALIEKFSPIHHTFTTFDEPFEMKVVAISRASENFFKHLGVWENVVNRRHCPYQRMAVWDNVMDGQIEFWACDYQEPNLGYIIEQRNLLAALSQKIAQQKNIKLLIDSPIDVKENDAGMQVLNLEKGESIRAQLIVAADGAHSYLRKKMGIKVVETPYQQDAIVAVVKNEKNHQNTAFQRFSPDGPLALLPLHDPYYSSIVWTTTPDKASFLCKTSATTFSEVLTKETNLMLGTISLVSPCTQFSLKAQHANAYFKKGFALVGDAAHTLHPLAGQGVNLGFLDVAALIEILVETKNRGRNIGSERVLARYERTRKYHNQMMISALSLFKHGFGAQNNLIMQLRNVALNWVDRRPMLKKQFVKLAFGAYPQYAMTKTKV